VIDRRYGFHFRVVIKLVLAHAGLNWRMRGFDWTLVRVDCRQTLVSKFRQFQIREIEKNLGEWLVIIGVGLEVIIGFAYAVKEELDSPLNQPITTVTAVMMLQFKGDENVVKQKATDGARPVIKFLLGTNYYKEPAFLGLVANTSDMESGVSVFGKDYYQTYAMNMHQTFEYSAQQAHKGMGKPAKSFNDVGCLIVEGSQFASKGELLWGIVTVTINSSLTWQFDLPPQKQTNGTLSARETKNGNVEILPVPADVFIR
jgi:hypothetical protein